MASLAIFCHDFTMLAKILDHVLLFLILQITGIKVKLQSMLLEFYLITNLCT